MTEVLKYEGEYDEESDIEYVQRIRRHMVTVAAGSDGVIENNEGNGILLRDLANTAIAARRLKQNDKSLDNQAQTASLVQQMLSQVSNGGGNLLTSNNTSTQPVSADIDGIGPEINPDTIHLGRQQLTLEDAGIDENEC